MESHFQMEVRDHSRAIIIDLAGDLSKNAQEPLLRFMNSWDRSNQSRFIILNFTKVPYINSLGIALLIRLVRTMARENYQTFAYGISPHYQKLFLMVGLTEHMMIYPDEYSIIQRLEALASS